MSREGRASLSVEREELPDFPKPLPGRPISIIIAEIFAGNISYNSLESSQDHRVADSQKRG
jgi:hypothetical protein